MSIDFVNSTKKETFGISVSPSIPSGVTADDFMVAFCYRGTTEAAVGWDNDGGGGRDWIQLINIFESPGRNQESAIYYKFATASESAPVFTSDGGANNNRGGTIVAYSNVDETTPFDVTFVQTSHYILTQNSNATIAKPITTVTDGALVLLFSGQSHNEISAWGAPSGYTLRAGLTGNNNNMGAASKIVATAGVETPAGWLNTDNGGATAENQDYTLALRPRITGVSSALPMASTIYRRRRI